MLYKFYWMRNFKKAQVGIEYMIIVAFVTIAILIVLSFAIFFSGTVQDKIKLNQVENFAIQVVNSAEMVFFSGEPSKTTLVLSMPDNVEAVSVNAEGILFTVGVSSGQNVRFFESRVPLSGVISNGEGVRKVVLTATPTEVVIS